MHTVSKRKPMKQRNASARCWVPSSGLSLRKWSSPSKCSARPRCLLKPCSMALAPISVSNLAAASWSPNLYQIGFKEVFQYWPSDTHLSKMREKSRKNILLSIYAKSNNFSIIASIFYSTWRLIVCIACFSFEIISHKNNHRYHVDDKI